jgi:hypothetical protein
MSTSANHAYAARSLASTGLIMTGASNKVRQLFYGGRWVPETQSILTMFFATEIEE